MKLDTSSIAIGVIILIVLYVTGFGNLFAIFG